MAKFAYKCCMCRKRHMFIKKLEEYKTRRMMHKNRSGKMVEIFSAKKCSCGHARFYVDVEKNSRTFNGKKRETCNCNSYPWPHRPQSRLCEKNENSELAIRTERYGEDKLDVIVDIGFNNNEILDPNEVCPF